MKYALWVAQVLLGLAFIALGSMKLTQPYEVQMAMMVWVAAVPEVLIRFIGAAEVLGGLGVLLPSVTRIMPRLTPLAAIGLMVVMVLALGFHVSRGEVQSLAPNVVLGLLAAFVAYGRTKLAPISPRRPVSVGRPVTA